MEKYSILKESDEDYQNKLNEFILVEGYIVFFVIGDGPKQNTIFEKATELAETTNMLYVFWLPELTSGIIQYLTTNVGGFDQLDAIQNFAMLGITMVSNKIAVKILIDDVIDETSIYEAYVTCQNID